MRAAGNCIHGGAGGLAVVVAVFDPFEQLVFIVNLLHGQALDLDAQFGTLAHLEVGLGDVDEVTDVFVLDLQHSHPDLEHVVGRRSRDFVEDFEYCARDDSARFGVLDIGAHHGPGFT